jgi:hypothetical protein
MKNKIYLIIIYLVINCIEAEPKISKETINKNDFEWDWTESIKYHDEKVQFKIFINKNSYNVLENIFNKLNVIMPKSSIVTLLEFYDIGLLEITNKSDNNFNFELEKLHVTSRENKTSPIAPQDLVKDIQRINIKGITKNVYNTLAIVTVTTAIIGIMVIANTNGANISCCSGSNQQSNDKVELEKFWSSFYQETTFDYQDLISSSNLIQPNSEKVGIIFLRKGLLNSKAKPSLSYQ